MIAIVEVPTFSRIPDFVPSGVLYYTQDTGDLYIGTGSSVGPAVDAVGGGGGFSASGTTTTATTALASVSVAPSGDVIISDGLGNVKDSGVLLSGLTSAWATLTGDLTSTQRIPFDGASVGTPDTNLSRYSAGIVAIGTGATSNTLGGIAAATATISAAAITTATVASGSLYITDIAANPDLVMFNTSAGTNTSTNASPQLTFAADYWTGSTSAEDTWEIGSAISAGTNGKSLLSFTHSGSSGAPQVSFPASSGVPGLVFNGGASGFGANGNSPQIETGRNSLQLHDTADSVTYGIMSGNTNGNGFAIQCGVTNIGILLGANSGLMNPYTNNGAVCVLMGADISGAAAVPFKATSGLQTNVSEVCTFSPTSGSASFVGHNISMTVTGTSSGNTTALLVNPTATLANLTGVNLLASFQSGGSQKAAIDYLGNFYSGTSTGVSAGPFSAITSIQTTGGIVTTLADVSDERLKDSAPYTKGLGAILNISPIRFTYNDAGAEVTGFDKERYFVGFSAQDVQKSIPEAVFQSATHPSYLSFDDRPVLASLVCAVKELHRTIQEQAAKIENLERAQL